MRIYKVDPKHEKYISENYLIIPKKQIARDLEVSQSKINRIMKHLNLEIPKEIRDKRKKMYCFPKGNVPFNKGLKRKDYIDKDKLDIIENNQFKKGIIPHNTKKDGYKRLSVDGYIYIRVNDKFVLEHRYNWELKNGKIQEDYILVCKDKNKQNTDSENWTCISREEHMLRNSRADFPEEIIPTLVLRNKLNKQIKILQNGTK